MFERNHVDNTPEPTFVPVELMLADGERVTGRLAVPIGRTTVQAINGEGSFVELERYSGERSFVAKTHIAELRIAAVPGQPGLKPRSKGHDEFDPHAILGVASTAAWDEIRQAFVQHSKTYHPDRYSTATLPSEVRDYLETMARRVNAAYAALDTTHKVVKHNTMLRTQPVYTSQPRG